jgi:hypothetical protein
MLIAKEALKIRNISSGSEDWGKAWDADDDKADGVVEEVSRMQRTLKVRCSAVPSEATVSEYQGSEATENPHVNTTL